MLEQVVHAEITILAASGTNRHRIHKPTLRTLAYMQPPPSDGALRRVADRIWIGRLHGYQVHVFFCGDGWCFAVISPQGYTEVCPRVASFTEGARQARKRIERDRPVADVVGCHISWLAVPPTGTTAACPT